MCLLSIDPFMQKSEERIIWHIRSFLWQRRYVSCFIVCTVQLKYIDLLHHTNISHFMQHVSSNLFHWCALHTTLGSKKVIRAAEPLALFHGICILPHRDASLENYFQFELSPYPLSLLVEAGIRKSRKSKLYSILQECDSIYHQKLNLWFMEVFFYIACWGQEGRLLMKLPQLMFLTSKYTSVQIATLFLMAMKR